ncbi:MAG: hypothetical protein OEX11_10685 [Nitrosomonas sp.]|nr:hypothetical protein [Nitrosomonas sp.]
MKIIVNFKSGFKQTFIVPKDMLAIEFRRLAEEIGGNIENIEFSLPPRQAGFSTSELSGILQLPE